MQYIFRFVYVLCKYKAENFLCVKSTCCMPATYTHTFSTPPTLVAYRMRIIGILLCPTILLFACDIEWCIIFAPRPFGRFDLNTVVECILNMCIYVFIKFYRLSKNEHTHAVYYSDYNTIF